MWLKRRDNSARAAPPMPVFMRHNAAMPEAAQEEEGET
jgi:hypothetical protein